MDEKRSKEEDYMQNRTSPDLTSKIRGYSRRLNARLRISAAERLSLQVTHSPIGVLGAPRRAA